MGNLCKAIFIAAFIFIIAGCEKFGETPDNPWIGFTKHKESEKFEWWLSQYSSYDECIEAMNWGITNTVHKAWYTKPVGCGYSSNNYFKAIYMNLLFADMKYFECLVESKKPESRKIKMKYGPILKGYKNDCVSNSKHEVIY